MTAAGPSTPHFEHTLSSGLFALPASAESVDWMIVNDSDTNQDVRVTVYRVGIGIGPKTPIPPGPLTVSIQPREATHNANSVGAGQPFQSGMYYEVVVELNDRRVLPSVHVWEDRGNTAVPGTLIPAGAWVDLQAP